MTSLMAVTTLADKPMEARPVPLIISPADETDWNVNGEYTVDVELICAKGSGKSCKNAAVKINFMNCADTLSLVNNDPVHYMAVKKGKSEKGDLTSWVVKANNTGRCRISVTAKLEDSTTVTGNSVDVNVV